MLVGRKSLLVGAGAKEVEDAGAVEPGPLVLKARAQAALEPGDAPGELQAGAVDVTHRRVIDAPGRGHQARVHRRAARHADALTADDAGRITHRLQRLGGDALTPTPPPTQRHRPVAPPL